MPAFVRLLRDTEAEVRVAAAGKVATFCKLLSNDQVCYYPALYMRALFATQCESGTHAIIRKGRCLHA